MGYDDLRVEAQKTLDAVKGEVKQEVKKAKKAWPYIVAGAGAVLVVVLVIWIL